MGCFDIRQDFEYYTTSGQKMNLSKSTIYFSLKTKVQLKQVIECLGIVEQDSVWRSLEVLIIGQRL